MSENPGAEFFNGEAKEPGEDGILTEDMARDGVKDGDIVNGHPVHKKIPETLPEYPRESHLTSCKFPRENCICPPPMRVATPMRDLVTRMMQSAEQMAAVPYSTGGETAPEYVLGDVDEYAIEQRLAEARKHSYQNNGRGTASCACGEWSVRLSDLSTDEDRAATFAYRKWEIHAGVSKNQKYYETRTPTASELVQQASADSWDAGFNAAFEWVRSGDFDLGESRPHNPHRSVS